MTYRALKSGPRSVEELRVKYEKKLKEMDETYREMVSMKDSMPEDLGQVF